MILLRVFCCVCEVVPGLVVKTSSKIENGGMYVSSKEKRISTTPTHPQPSIGWSWQIGWVENSAGLMRMSVGLYVLTVVQSCGPPRLFLEWNILREYYSQYSTPALTLTEPSIVHAWGDGPGDDATS